MAMNFNDAIASQPVDHSHEVKHETYPVISSPQVSGHSACSFPRSYCSLDYHPVSHEEHQNRWNANSYPLRNPNFHTFAETLQEDDEIFYALFPHARLSWNPHDRSLPLLRTYPSSNGMAATSPSDGRSMTEAIQMGPHLGRLPSDALPHPMILPTQQHGVETQLKQQKELPTAPNPYLELNVWHSSDLKRPSSRLRVTIPRSGDVSPTLRDVSPGKNTKSDVSVSKANQEDGRTQSVVGFSPKRKTAIRSPSSPRLTASSSSVSPTSEKPVAAKKQSLACIFCRSRKIACQSQSLDGDKTCNQCRRRGLKCEYPLESRRGMHKKKAPLVI